MLFLLYFLVSATFYCCRQTAQHWETVCYCKLNQMNLISRVIWIVQSLIRDICRFIFLKNKLIRCVTLNTTQLTSEDIQSHTDSAKPTCVMRNLQSVWEKLQGFSFLHPSNNSLWFITWTLQRIELQKLCYSIRSFSGSSVMKFTSCFIIQEKHEHFWNMWQILN